MCVCMYVLYILVEIVRFVHTYVHTYIHVDYIRTYIQYVCSYVCTPHVLKSNYTPLLLTEWRVSFSVYVVGM